MAYPSGASARRPMCLKSFMAIACTSFVVATSAQAQEFPSKHVTLMMPYAAGGPGDTLTRIIGQGMGKVLGRQFLVENVAGAGGTLGTAKVAASAPASSYAIAFERLKSGYAAPYGPIFY